MTNEPMPVAIPDAVAEGARLQGRGLVVGYDDREVLHELDVQIPDGAFTVIIEPNACGKSTLLKTLARLLPPSAGQVVLDGHSIHQQRSKDVARVLGLLPQSPFAPDGITVAELVARGRSPHQNLISRWSHEDQAAVNAALAATGVGDLRDDGRTVVAVLHDINHAIRYADHLIAMRDGYIVAEGAPEQIVTAPMIEEVFGLRARVVPDPELGVPIVLPALP
ncbi:ABC transporter ATP-binding protein [Occultella kanbiaonis]|uniref:ABC transporter ATP-binding protein n=1 Tax=Occultella kanbiaonis TaxID=2675754 RepID=UPI00140975D9|nr:ABC transporter ATP-binding protein [Occultella kanbiaonis]